MSVAEQTLLTSKSPRRIPSAVRLGPQLVDDLCTQPGTVKAERNVRQDAIGLLFGTADQDLLNVVAIKAFPGPVTSEIGSICECLDRSFECLLTEAKADPGLTSLQLLGWYCVRSSSNITPLAETDLAFHNRRFRRATDVALFLRLNQHGAASIDLMELYSRSYSTAALSNQSYRRGSLLLADAERVNTPRIVAMRESVDDEYYFKVFRVLDSLDRAERREHWKKVALRLMAIAPPNLRPGWMRRQLAPAANTTAPQTSGLPVQTVVQTSPLPGNSAKQGLNPASSLRTKLRWTLAASLTVAVGMALAWLYGRLILSSLPSALFHRASSNAPLSMRVEPQVGGTLLLKWDVHSAATRSAKSGSVQIDDGSEHHEIYLDPNQIANGSILYTPVSKDLTFQLQVIEADGKPISESMRMVNGSKAPLAAHVVAGARTERTVTTTSVPDEKRTSHQRSSGTFQAKAKPLTEIPKKQSSTETPAGQPASDPLVNSRTGRAAASPAPTTPLDASPARTSRSTSSATANALVPARYVAPRPLKQIMPNAINPTSLAFPGPTDVEVEVRIDAEGHVTEARLLDSKPYNNESVTNAALAAAKEWIFEPAKMYGKNVQSGHTIRFHFTPR